MGAIAFGTASSSTNGATVLDITGKGTLYVVSPRSNSLTIDGVTFTINDIYNYDEYVPFYFNKSVKLVNKSGSSCKGTYVLY